MAERQVTLKTLSTLPEGFWDRIIADLDGDDVITIFLHGSHARGDATPYSDIDLVRLVNKEPDKAQQKQYTYRDGYLISISTRTLSTYWEWFAQPERAIFVVPGVQEAHVLLDKTGAFRILQQKARDFCWEPLQEAANAYSSTLMAEQAEIVHKALRALLVQDKPALAEMTLILLNALTDAISVQRGIMAKSGNSYFEQVQESVGQQSRWTHYHRSIAGLETTYVALDDRGKMALQLYQETARLLLPSLHPTQRETIMRASEIIEESLSHK